MSNFKELMGNAQYLGIGLSQWLNIALERGSLSKNAARIAEQFGEFIDSASSLKDIEDIVIFDDFANTETPEQRQRAVKIVSHAKLVADMRALTSEASTAIQELLEEEDE